MGPEGCLDRESGKGRALGDSAEQRGGFLVLLDENLNMLLLAVSPILSLLIAQFEELFGG